MDNIAAQTVQLHEEFELGPSLLFSLVTPPNGIIRVFKNRSFLTGFPRVDSGTLSTLPWDAAMKWKEHMELRGWEMTGCENQVIVTQNNRATVLVAVLMEKLR